MKLLDRAEMAGIILLFLVLLCGFTSGEVPPISVQNAHTTISADFSADIQQGTVPLIISFHDSSAGVIDHYEWDFGDGEISTEMNPVHAYYEPGVFTVSLSVSGTGGSDKKTRIGYISALDLSSNSDLTSDNENKTTPDLNSDVVQNGELFIPPGTISNESLPDSIHTESVILTELNNKTVSPDNLVHADFAVIDATGLAPLKVTFSDLSTGPVITWNWDFGDGTSSAAISPVHIFQNPGIYDITLTVEGDGDTNSITKSQAVQVIAPVKAAFTAESIEGIAPFDVSFREQSTGTILNRSWTFGDGFQSDLENPIHRYENPGTYEVTLKVSGTHNEDVLTRPSYIIVHEDLPPPPSQIAPVSTPTTTPSATLNPEPDNSFIPVNTPLPTPEPNLIPPLPVEENMEVPDQPEPIITPQQPEATNIISQVINYQISPDTGTAPLFITCIDDSTGPVTSWLWQFGDNTSSTEQNPSHTYISPGTYTLNLTIYGPGAETGLSKETDILVSSPPIAPIADFLISNREGPAPLPIVCTDQSTGEINEWIWDFGDGKILRGKNPTHTYSLPGQYSITLRVKGPGGKDEIRKEGIISVSYPQAELQAAFTSSNVNGDAPLEVSFTDQSTGIITSWNWQFGDGANSSEQHPIHIFSNPGVYNVTLEVTGPDGTSQVTQEGIITAVYNPTPIKTAFSAIPISGEAPLTVSFTDLSIGDISSWNWQFGDGESSDMKDVVHSYAQPGIYSVTLETSGPGGQDKITKPDYISVRGSTLTPEIFITADPAEGTAPLAVTFNKSIIGNELGIIWEFGDGNISQEEKPVHIYSQPGIYDISLTIHDTNGNNRTISKNQLVNVTAPLPAPIASFISNVSEGTSPCTIRFTDTSQGQINDWFWEFGDGMSDIIQDPIHTFINPGSYSVHLTVTGPGGSDKSSDGQIIIIQEPIQTSREVKLEQTEFPTQILDETEKPISEEINSDIMILNESSADEPQPISEDKINASPSLPSSDVNIREIISEPIVNNTSPNELLIDESHPMEIPSISSSVTSGSAPLNVQFTSSWGNDTGTYIWSFGDGTISNETEPEHTYHEPGTYTIHLTKESENGVQEIISNNLIQVRQLESTPVASFRADPVSGSAPLNVTFTSDTSGTITNYLWKFGDSTQDTGEIVTHSYTRPGTYSVSLMVNGSAGTSEEVRENLITVGPQLTPPQAKFRTDKRTGFAPLTVNFTDQSLGKVSDWKWDFGDGTSVTDKNPTHIFNETGIFSISLTVSGPTGTNSVSRKGYIVVSERPEPLVAQFSLKPTKGDAPLLVQCNDSSTGIINRYLWEFGDGAVSENKNPSHQYTTPGSYTIQLTIYGNSGVSSADQGIIIGPTLTKPKRIHGQMYNVENSEGRKNNTSLDDLELTENKSIKPVADFTITQKSGNSPLNVSFIDKSSGSVETWNWDFGDGNTSQEQNPSHIYVNSGVYTVQLSVEGPFGISTKKLRDGIRVL